MADQQIPEPTIYSDPRSHLREGLQEVSVLRDRIVDLERRCEEQAQLLLEKDKILKQQANMLSDLSASEYRWRTDATNMKMLGILVTLLYFFCYILLPCIPTPERTKPIPPGGIFRMVSHFHELQHPE